MVCKDVKVDSRHEVCVLIKVRGREGIQINVYVFSIHATQMTFIIKLVKDKQHLLELFIFTRKRHFSIDNTVLRLKQYFTCYNENTIWFLAFQGQSSSWTILFMIFVSKPFTFFWGAS